MKTGLVLQGGGTRGAFTSGVLLELAKENIKIDCIYGISAGGLNGLDYIAKHPEKNKDRIFRLFGNKKFANIWNVIFRFSLLNYNILFNEVQKEIPFDENTFFKNETDLCVGCTSLKDCDIHYFYKSKESKKDFYKAIKASASLAPYAKHVRIHGIPYVDGGDVVAIPYQQAIDDGCDKIIVVTTRMLDFRKAEYRDKTFNFIHKLVYWVRPNYLKYTINESWKKNNQEYVEIQKLQKEGKLFIISPREDVVIGSVEKNIDKYNYYCDLGKNDYKKIRPELLKYLKS